MKKILLYSFFLGGAVAHGQQFLNVANGPNAPEVGTIVPDEVTYAMSDIPASDLLTQAGAEGNTFRFPALREVSYSDFENEIVATVYHTPW